MVADPRRTSPRGARPVDDVLSDRAQTLRGLACLLLVAFHVVVDNSVAGLETPGDGPYQRFAHIFQPLRMPLFTFLSGFVYAYRPVDAVGWLTFLRKKTWRLLIPFVAVTTLLFLFQYATGHQRSLGSLRNVYLYTFAHMWFLQALMVILAIIVLLELMELMKTLARWAVVLVLALCVDVTIEVSPNYFSINQAFHLLPFFIAGLGANRFRDVLERRAIRWPLAVLFLGCFAVHALGTLRLLDDHPLPPGLVLATISFAGALTLIRHVPPMGWLITVGSYSFAIYLFHVFFTASARMLLDMADVPRDRLLYFIVALLAGLAGPVAVERALRPVRVARAVLLGQTRGNA